MCSGGGAEVRVAATCSRRAQSQRTDNGECLYSSRRSTRQILVLQVLLQWLNDTLEGKRIIARDIVEDLYDGQILGELLCKCRQCVNDLSEP